MKLFLRFLWWLTFVVLAVIILAVTYREKITKQVAEREIRSTLGLEAEIGGVTFSLLEPKVTFYNLKLYNTADFGGTLFLDIPELHVEYDPAALRHRQLHITFMRLNVNEMDVVKNAAALTNIYSIIRVVAPTKPGGGRTFVSFKGARFTGIDLLNLSIGTVKFVDLNNQRRNRSLPFDIQYLTMSDIKSPANLSGLESYLWNRGGNLVGLPR